MIYFQMIDTEEEKILFEQTYYKYKYLVYSVAFDILKNSYDAEDVVQYTFMKIAENLNRFDLFDHSKTIGYIATIARNRAIDIYRKKVKNSSSDFWLNECYEYNFDGMGLLAQCIMQLPEIYRSTIVLKYYYGYSIREIADILDISKENAKKIDYRARQKLHSLLYEEDVQ